MVVPGRVISLTLPLLTHNRTTSDVVVKGYRRGLRSTFPKSFPRSAVCVGAHSTACSLFSQYRNVQSGAPNCRVSQVCSAQSADAELAVDETPATSSASEPGAELNTGSEQSDNNKEASDTDANILAKQLKNEVAKRRNFAIISHPDAGKTTLTEKLLLYGGAIHEAGAVKARRAAKHVTSDWMEMEKTRGISITSTAMVFNYGEHQINLLDTPGHADFSEDTYRTLVAADNALMLIDAAKGLEPQTRKLFAVCRSNGLPVFTFVNKMDRPALDPLEILDQVEKEFDLPTYAVNWPIGSGDQFRGVFHRPTRELHLFQRDGAKKGQREGTSASILPWGSPEVEEALEPEAFARLADEIELLDELGGELDMEAVLDGQLTPVFFGSGMNNFGVELFLSTFLGMAARPRAHTSAGEHVAPTDADFSGFVFKLQANMDPRHRDRVAFLRVCSGTFERGMKVKNARTGKQLALSRPQKLFGQDREVMDEGFAGDIIGLNNPGAFAIGDTVYAGKARSFPGIPSFSPELFAYLRNPNPSSYKSFTKGLDELLGEGAVQVMYPKDNVRNDPILAAVGQLQFEVVQHRMQEEYGVETTIEPLPYQVARWVENGWDAVEKVGRIYNAAVVKDNYGRPVLLFKNVWNVDQLLADSPEIGNLLPFAMPPATVENTKKKGKK